MQAGGFAPDGGRLAFAGRAAPLGQLPLEVGPCERPGAVLALGRAMLAALHCGRLAERDDRQGANALARRIGGRDVVALVERRRLRLDALADTLQEVVGQARFIRSRCLDLPREAGRSEASIATSRP